MVAEPSLDWSPPSIHIAPVPDPEDEVAFVGPRVDHAKVPDPQLEQAGELAGECLAPESLGRQDSLEPVYGPSRLGATKVPQVLRD